MSLSFETPPNKSDKKPSRLPVSVPRRTSESMNRLRSLWQEVSTTVALAALPTRIMYLWYDMDMCSWTWPSLATSHSLHALNFGVLHSPHSVGSGWNHIGGGTATEVVRISGWWKCPNSWGAFPARIFHQRFKNSENSCCFLGSCPDKNRVSHCRKNMQRITSNCVETALVWIGLRFPSNGFQWACCEWWTLNRCALVVPAPTYKPLREHWKELFVSLSWWHCWLQQCKHRVVCNASSISTGHIGIEKE